MKTLPLAIAALLAFSTVTVPAAMAGNHSGAKAAIEAVDAEFEAALSAGSASRLAAVYTKDGQALPPNGPVVSGREALETFWQGAVDAGLASVELETVELEEFGDSAVQVGRYTLRAADGTTADVGKLMILWKKEEGEWRWHRDIWNSSKPAK